MFNITGYRDIVNSFYKELLKVQEKTNIRLTEDKWALSEIIGHLIDSASNNHQRFVRLQFDDLLDFPAYDTEEWIKAQKYIEIKWSVLVELWYNYNCLLLNIIENAELSAYENVWVKGDTAIPLEQLVKEYYIHLKVHIDHFKKRQEEMSEIKF